MSIDQIPRTAYNEDHEAFRETVRRFMKEEIAPNRAQWAKDKIVPREIWPKAGELGMLCPTVPEEYGGLGLDFGYNAIVDEEGSYTGGAATGFSLQSDIVCNYLIAYGSEEQKKKWLPRMVSGETITAIAMTEPGVGSDLQAITTTAKKDGNHYVVNGSKTYITNGQNADLVLVCAKTDPDAEPGWKGVSIILVEADREGFERGRNLDKIGMDEADTSELFFNDVRVPTANLLGHEEGLGFIQLMQQLPQERLQIGGSAIAMCERALAVTIDYVKERKAFGKAVIEFQNTQFTLAELKTEATIGRTFYNFCVGEHLEGRLTPELASMAKYWLSDLQGKITDACLQLHGGYGYMNEYPIARMFRDARVQRIYGGTNEIMKLLIARGL